LGSKAPLPDKNADFSKWYDQVSEKAELADVRYGVKGFVVYRPNLMFIIEQVYESLERHLLNGGHRKILFPLLIPFKNLLVEKEHVKGFENQVFIVEKAGQKKLEEKLFIRPTSETAIYPMYSLWIRSHRDLPLKVFQSVAVYRHETRATRPLFRGREFLWIESHDVFEDQKGALVQIKDDLQTMQRTFEEFALPFIPIEREPFDRFPGAERSFAYDSLLPDKQALQAGTTHYLGTNFTKPFEVSFLAKDGTKKVPESTCFGPGVTRIAGLVAAMHGDEYGLVLPFKAAMIQVIIIPIAANADVLQYAARIAEELTKAGFRVELDKGPETAGEKFYKWEMVGVPVRIEVGPKETASNNVTLVRRDLRTRELIDGAKVVERTRQLESEILKELRNRSWQWLNSNIHQVSNREEIQKMSKIGGFIKFSYCGRKVCADELKAGTGGVEVRGSRIDIKEVPDKVCSWCGEKAVRVAYAAKAY
jgi:prolyl-tRNA synthetase